MAYPKDEQETVIVYEAETGLWSFYSTHPPHIRKYKELLVDATMTEDQYGINSIRGRIEDANVRISKKRVMSEEQRAALAERMRKMREAQNT
ncbi:hypothetical protein EVJ32_04585 [Exiguobacterium sp. SH5S4]|uniref:hypothetical protein n=1 Tax=Exiguobacterium sp. SH5S4 TaxID=2510961 RepID=UPI0010399E5A|nr:hypothetical protein [Exiguobacterium sp. SH5S4]TCI26654.1 hypothetical protein EVJ32_04585 [Exiguobacterium sp. SH5S4]